MIPENLTITRKYGVRVSSRSYGPAVCQFCGVRFSKTNANQGPTCSRLGCQDKRRQKKSREIKERQRKARKI